MPLKIETVLDNSELKRGLEQTKSAFDELATYIKKKDFGEAFQKQIGDVSKQIGEMIKTTEQGINDVQAKIDDLIAKRNQATASGDGQSAGQFQYMIDGLVKERTELLKNLSHYETYKDKLVEIAGTADDFLEKQEKKRAAVAKFGAAIKTGAVGGMKALIAATKAFLKIGLVAAVSAITSAFMSLVKWFKNTEEGQNAIARASGYLKGVFASLKSTAAQVGKALFNAFKTVKPVIEAVVNRVAALVSVVTALVNIGQAAFSGNKDDVKKEFENMKASLKAIWTGELTGGAKEIKAQGEAAADLYEEREKLRRQEKKWAEEKADYDLKIAEAEKRGDTRTAQSLNNEKRQKEIDLLEKQYDVEKQLVELKGEAATLDDEDRLREMRTQITEAKTDKIQAESQAGNKGESAADKAQRERERLEREEEQRAKKEEQLQNELNALLLENEQARIDLMEDGTDKELAEIRKNYEKREEEIRKQEVKWKRLNEETGVAGLGEDGLTEEQRKAVTDAKALIKSQTEQDISRVYKKLIDEYKGFVDEWEELTEKFNKDRMALTLSGDFISNPRLWDSFSAKEREAFEQLSEQWAKSGRDEGFKKWFEELGQQSFVDLGLMLDDLEFQMQEFGDSLPDEEAKKLTAQILLLKKAIRENNGDDGIVATAQNAIPNWTELNQVLTETASLFQQVGDIVGGVMGEAIAYVGKFSAAVAKIGNSAEAIKKATSSMEKMGGYLAIAGAVMSITGETISLVKRLQERTDQLELSTNEYYNTLKKIADSHLLDSFSNAFGTNAYGAFVASMGIAKEANDAIDDNIKKYKEWAKAIGGLYDAASGTTAFSDRFASGLYSDMRTDWQRYWGTGKDNEFYASWEQFFDESGNLLGEELRAWVEKYGEGMDAEARKIVDNMLAEFDRLKEAKSNISAYLGEMFGDVASNLASSMIDSFLATGDAIQDMSKYMNDFAKNVAKSIVQSKLMAKVFKEEDQDAIADLLAAGKTSDAIAYYNSLLEKVNNLVPGINSFLEGLNLQNLDAASNRTGLSQGVATASQDSIDALSGMMTVVQGHTFEIKESLTGFSAQYETLIANTAAMLEHTQGIHVDTTEIKEIQAQIAELSRSINSNVSTIVDRGVIMR